MIYDTPDGAGDAGLGTSVDGLRAQMTATERVLMSLFTAAF